MEANDAVSIGATARTFAVLSVVQEARVVGVADVAAALDIPRSTAHDYLSSLTALGYLVRDEDGYRLGVRFLELGESARREREIFGIARPEIERLAAETGEHANLLIEEHGEGVFLYKATGENAVQLDTHPGMVVPLHTTALGKTIMAHLTEDRVYEIIERHGLPEVTEKTITDEEQLFAALETVREQGYAVDDEERIEGMRCIAAPIIHEGDVVAAVSLSGPVTRFEGERLEKQLPNQVRSTANVIEVNMTHT
jgi:DNA-binding IclR family transcriptional regulator